MFEITVGHKNREKITKNGNKQNLEYILNKDLVSVRYIGKYILG